MPQDGHLSTGSIVGIVFAVMGFLTSISLHIFFHLRREKKREQKEREEKEKADREKADLEKGNADGSTPTIEEGGLAPKPELEGTMVGAVMPKMELDSQPVAELPNVSRVGELDGSPSASTSQLGQKSASTPTKQPGVAYELPG
ncbi:uncharacterized protein F4807DRAFT_63182 [Annulohypoxylon truncatum]|uniref:uncharacterized protein n=1 Tax=Annulohypoxylon truncatum TaxID=327061 RepID=UPI0020089B55|nr:uncharacterized protein F4807DRAFT_63182 [Annulohypoxylon truncatum]KAI1210379.1 hypothetical protein F4807DRAFT_63182 [Annulohypoxylon truncatum]